MCQILMNEVMQRTKRHDVAVSSTVTHVCVTYLDISEPGFKLRTILHLRLSEDIITESDIT